MSDTIEAFKDMKEVRQQRGERQRIQAEADFQAAATLAYDAGLRLTKKDPTHYQLEHPKAGWLINLYPGNQRICADKMKARAPYLSVGDEWTLIDAVKAAIEKVQS